MRKKCNHCGEYKHSKRDFYKRANNNTPRNICKRCFIREKDIYRGLRHEKPKPEKRKLHDNFQGY